MKCRPIGRRVIDWISGQGSYPGCSSIPGGGAYQYTTSRCFSLTLMSLFLPLFLPPSLPFFFSESNEKMSLGEDKKKLNIQLTENYLVYAQIHISSLILLSEFYFHLSNYSLDTSTWLCRCLLNTSRPSIACTAIFPTPDPHCCLLSLNSLSLRLETLSSLNSSLLHSSPIIKIQNLLIFLL